LSHDRVIDHFPVNLDGALADRLGLREGRDDPRGKGDFTLGRGIDLIAYLDLIIVLVDCRL